MHTPEVLGIYIYIGIAASVQKRRLHVDAERILDAKWCRSITTILMLDVQTGFPPIAAFGAKSAGKGAALSLV